MAENKVAVEITLEEKAALKALTQLTREIQKTESGFTKMGDSGDANLSAVSRSAKATSQDLKISEQRIREAEEAFRQGFNNTATATKASAKELKEFEQRTQEAEKASKGMFSELKSGAQIGFGQLVGGITIANLASEAIIGTARSIKQFAVDSINASIEQENALRKVGQALFANGQYSATAVAEFDEYSDSIERMTGVAGDQILSQIAIAKSFGATNKQAKDLVLAAINLSATFGGDLDTSVKQLGQTMNGEVGKLGKLVPELKNLDKEALKSGRALEIINEKFAGAGASQVETYSGRVTQLSNSFGKLQEELGNFVTKNEITKTTLAGLASGFEAMASGVKSASQSLGIGLGPIEEQRFKLRDLGLEYNSLKNAIDTTRISMETNAKYGGDRSQEAEQLKNIAAAEIRMNEILKERLTIRQGIVKDQEVAKEDKAPNKDTGLSSEDKKRIESYKTAEAEIRYLKEQSLILDQEQQALLDVQAEEKKELEIQKIYEFEALKLEAQFAMEEEKARVISDSRERSLKLQEISAKREVEFTKLSNKQIVDEIKKRAAEEEKVRQSNLTAAQGFLSAGIALSKEGSREQKALSYADAIVNTYAAGMRAYKDYPYPANIGVMASTIAAGMVNVRNISRYEQGGILGGSHSTGDHTLYRGNKDEMVLNKPMQLELYNVAKGRGGSSVDSDVMERFIEAILNQPIQLILDGRVLATSIRKEIQGGFRLY